VPLLLPCLTLGQTKEKKEKAKPIGEGSVEQAVLKLEEYGDVQLFYCRHCKKKFTPLVNKHKSFFASSAESVGYKIGANS
jgi:uncharacterized CHY-type Zn-finger protein